MMNKKMLIEIASFAYILLFSYAASSKMFDLRKFEGQLIVQPFNDAWVPYLLWGIPASLVITVLILLVPRYRLFGLKMATALMIVFTGYVSLAEFGYYKDHPCTCAGVINQFTWGQHLCFNLVFLVIGILAIISRFDNKKLKLN